MFLMDIVIIYFIEYELDEFEINWIEWIWNKFEIHKRSTNVCEWCGVWSRHSIFRKRDTVVRLLWCALFGDSIYLRRYLDSTNTLHSYRWRLPVSKESKEVHMVMSEVWNMSWSEYDIWINPCAYGNCTWDWDKNWSGQTISRVWNMSWLEHMDGIWQVQTS